MINRVLSINRVVLAALAFLLLFLPVYSYACLFPMMGIPGDLHGSGCALVECGLSSSGQTSQKYCETLKRVDTQSDSILKGNLDGLQTVQPPAITQMMTVSELSMPPGLLDPPRSFNLLPPQDLYILHHILLI